MIETRSSTQIDLDSRLLSLLRHSNEFKELPDDILIDLAEALTYQYYQGGCVISHEGDKNGSFIILVSGRLRVSRTGPDNKLLLYNEIYPGESVGQIGLTIDQPNTSDIIATRDSILAVLTQDNFEKLLLKHPVAVNQIFTRAIYNNLHHIRYEGERRQSHSFAVVPLHPEVDGSAVAKGLADALRSKGSACYIAPEYIQVTAPTSKDGFSPTDSHFSIGSLEAENDYLVFLAEFNNHKLSEQVCRQADQIIFIANADASPELAEIEKRIADEPRFAFVRKHLVLVQRKRGSCQAFVAPWKVKRELERIYPLSLDSTEDFQRLARFLTGHAVGVVLGGGGARGFAHLGVMRALEESGVPIDLIGGNSMGALIGALYAYGVPRDEIHQLILSQGGNRFRPNLPFVSMLSNVPFEKVLRSYFGETSIESLWLPFFATACNLSKARTIVLESGPLWLAVLASNSPAGLLPPVLLDGNLLVDGAILENVPVRAMRSRLGIPLERRRGNGALIAIDVDIRQELVTPISLVKIKPMDVLKSRFIRSSPPIPSMIDILLQAGHIGGMAQREQTKALADHYLEPPVSSYSMMNFGNAEAIIEAGYRYASEQITTWGSTT
jgi:predicted acylesterase/phospholipase RssA